MLDGISKSNGASTLETVTTTPITRDEIADASARLEGQSPETILRWGVERYFPRLTMATAFGAEGCCIIHMLAPIEPRVRIFNLETGYQFPETMQVRERIKDRYGIEVELVTPDTTVAEYEEEHGGPLYAINPDQCCFDRKKRPLVRALAGYEAWISAIRADQTKHRARADVVQWDGKFNLAKLNPLLNWTRNDVWSFILKHEIPYNPLHDQGYPSIGCWPCTRAVAIGEDERAGRWAGTDKKECGLHVIEHEGGSGI
ncbi:MAG: phosphoadenylyl-sulfate reductase [Planctomycetes bacterium]|nr:phosphoadenylyl-sulfate reductase [Planctomycetota bacterium]